ncbi:MAG: Asp-tRNA(Asn)/Glu-tRNA(Gln) amidotransferase subunit GatC [Sphingomonadaceae bacterium]|nr:Asp-tRNA(Asn)/Glu-tRNA(Gln) amidotransferase subunit GatC [Sphingomonadaceae bacterium]
MSVDRTTVRRIAHLARLRVSDSEVEPLTAELNGILGWIEQLSEVDVTGIEPMTSVLPLKLRWREDAVTDGGYPEKVLMNAPAAVHGFFGVPKVID